MKLYQDYLKLKEQNPDGLLFCRFGDFFELYGDDAIKASRELDLILTTRDCGQNERVPMCGIPYHSSVEYAKKLVVAGYKILIYDPTKQDEQTAETAKEANVKLNLTAMGAEQTLIKEYLEKNTSDVLVEKINNGVKVVKDGKTLINKKTLESFMQYAYEEAKKLAEKGAKSACVKDDIVFGWAIHYFEEDSIEGNLYNEDGSEYKPKPAPKANTAKQTTAATTTVSKPKPNDTQFSLFDMLDTKSEEKSAEEVELDEIEDDESEVEEMPEVPEAGKTEYVDKNGEILSVVNKDNNVCPEWLVQLFGKDNIIAR